jgi:hypothetical protein
MLDASLRRLGMDGRVKPGHDDLRRIAGPVAMTHRGIR